MTVKFYDGYSASSSPSRETVQGVTGLQGLNKQGEQGATGCSFPAANLDDLDDCIYNHDTSTEKSIYIGYSSGRVGSGHTGIYNVGIGYYNQHYSNGSYNTTIGSEAGKNIFGGNYNTSIGVSSGYTISSGSYNTCLGVYASPYSGSYSYSTCIGYSCQTGSRSVIIGYSSTANVSDSVIIGAAIDGTYDGSNNLPNNSVLIGGPNTTRIFLRGVLYIEPVTSNPSSPTEADIIYNSTDHKLRYYNGTSWVDC